MGGEKPKKEEVLGGGVVRSVAIWCAKRGREIEGERWVALRCASLASGKGRKYSLRKGGGNRTKKNCEGARVHRDRAVRGLVTMLSGGAEGEGPRNVAFKRTGEKFPSPSMEN